MSRIVLLLAAAITATPAPAAEPEVGFAHVVTPFSFRYLVFTPDGRQLVSFEANAAVRVCDAASGKHVRTLWLPRTLAHGRYDAADISPDGRRLALPTGDRFLVLDLADESVTAVGRGHAGRITGLAFAPDGRTVATVGHDRQLKLWEPDTGRCRATFAGVGPRGFTALAWSPDGKALATAELDGPVRVWDAATGRSQPLTRKAAFSHRLLWRPDGKAVAVLSHPHAWQVVGLDGGILERDDAMRSDLASARFDRDGRLVVPPRGGKYEAFRMTVAATGAAAPPAPGHPRVGEGVAVSAAGDRFAHYGDRGELVVRSLADGAVLARTANPEREWTRSVGWSADGKSLLWTATGARGEKLAEHAFDLTDLRLSTPPPNAPRTTARHADATRKITRFGDYGYTLTRLPTGGRVTLEPSQTADDFLVRGVTLLADERAAVASDWGLALHDTMTGAELFQYRAPGAGSELSPSPDGRYFATSGRVSVFSVTAPDPLLSVQAVGDRWVVWTPGGYYAAGWPGDLPVGRFIDHGPDRLAEFVPLNRLPGRNRPDVIRRLLAAGSVEAALRQAGK